MFLTIAEGQKKPQIPEAQLHQQPPEPTGSGMSSVGCTERGPAGAPGQQLLRPARQRLGLHPRVSAVTAIPCAPFRSLSEAVRYFI